MKITKFVPDFAQYATVWPSSFISSGSNSLAVAEITSNGSNVAMLPIVNFAAGSGISLSQSSNSITISATGGGAGGSLEVKEQDGSPDLTSVSVIKVPNGTLRSNAGAELWYPSWFNVKAYGALGDGATWHDVSASGDRAVVLLEIEIT